MHVRQPFAVLGFSFASALFLCAWLTAAQMRLLLPVFLLLLIIGSVLYYKRKGAAILLTSLMCILAVIISLIRHDSLWDIAEAVDGQQVIITGTSSSGNADEGILVRNAALITEDRELKADILLYGNGDLVIYSGETFSVSASLQGIASASQQGKGAQLVAWADPDTLQILSGQPFFDRLRDSVRSFLIANIRSAIPDSETAAMTIAVLTGDDSAIPAHTYSLYQRSGIAHILCVSGLHLSILSAIILALLTFAGRRPALVLSMIIMGGFVWMTGAGTSALRAWIMVCLVMTAELFLRDAAPVNSLGLAVLVLTLCEPALVCRMGFLLSVTSVLAVTAVAPFWQNTAIRLFGWEEEPFPDQLLGLLLPSAAVSLTTLPVMMLFHGYIPALSPLINMLILPLMPLLLLAGLAAGLTGWSFAGFICQKILTFFGLVAEQSAKGPILPLRSGYALIAVGCCALLALLVFLLKGRDRARSAVGLLSVIVLCGSYIFDTLSRQDTLTVTQYAFSRGSSIVLQHGGNAVVIGAGGSSYESRQLTSVLLANGVQTVDALIIPADKLAYTGGSYDLLVSMGADTVVTPPSSRVQQGLDFGAVRQVFPLGDSLWSLFDTGSLRLHTGGNSAAVTVQWHDKTILLDTSDNKVPWPADVRLIYDKKAEESPTTRENYAIMISSGGWLRPAAELVLPAKNNLKGAV